MPSKSLVAVSLVDPRPSVSPALVPIAASPNSEKPVTPQSRTVTVLPSSSMPSITFPQQSSSFFAPKQPSPTVIEFERPKLSVTYNPDINQTLHIDLANTFDVTNPVFCAKFNLDGKYLAVGGSNKGSKIYIFDVEKGSIARFVPFLLRLGYFTDFGISSLVDLYLDDKMILRDLEFSPDSKLIATASSDRRIRVCSSVNCGDRPDHLILLVMGCGPKANPSHIQGP